MPKTKPIEARSFNAEDARRERAVDLFSQKVAEDLGPSVARDYRPDIEYLENALVKFGEAWAKAEGKA